MLKKVLVLPAMLVVWLSLVIPLQGDGFYAVPEGGDIHLLNGHWNFAVIEALEAEWDGDFFEAEFDDSSWSQIKVPANWEMEGFVEPHYGKNPPDRTGYYRKTLRLPQNWKNEGRTLIRFDGVAFGFDLYVNGQKIGSSTSGAYTPHTFDISDALASRPNGEHLIAMKVETKPLAWEFDNNDDWWLSGIFREVSIFTIPETHLTDFTFVSKLWDDGSVGVSVSVEVNRAGAEISGELFTPQGDVAAVFGFGESGEEEGDEDEGVRYHRSIVVEDPMLWTAETPSLYKLRLRLRDESGAILQTFEKRVGLREVSIENKILLVNGKPVELRGANRHDLEPTTGRAVTEEGMRKDLEIMKAANMNFVRTSHYPPHPRFIELCDELGFYVMDEVAIGRGEEHQADPAYLDSMMARAEALLRRDKNHASVIIWAVGNENLVTDLLLQTGERVKEIDPTRPICFPMSPYQFDDDWEKLPEFVDIYATHYPLNSRLLEYVDLLKRPVILTEYAHALGLATGRIQYQWDVIRRTPHFAGGAIWHLMDQGILRKSDTPVDRSKPTREAWLDANHYYDNHDSFGQDGIVYTDRSPQTDFWQTRSVYAPVQILEESLELDTGKHGLELTVENRFDFRSLRGIEMIWSLMANGAAVEEGVVDLSAKARERETVAIPVEALSETENRVAYLKVRFVDDSRWQISERSLRIGKSVTGFDPKSVLPSAASIEVSETEQEIAIVHPDWKLVADRTSGAVQIYGVDGEVLVDGIYPHVGRRLTLSEHFNARETETWRETILTDSSDTEVTLKRTDSQIELSVGGRFERPGSPEQAIRGGFVLTVPDSGPMSLGYEYTFEGAKGPLSEVGLSFVAPEELDEFNWIGQGPYAGYPGKDRLNGFGIFQLNLADLWFQGNRRATELAVLANEKGEGIALVPETASDIAVEITGEQTLLKHNAMISGLGNKIGRAETLLESAEIKSFSGVFSLSLFSEAWPRALIELIGEPGRSESIYQPFYHSYDQ
ncbi:glycoside hydrolase family 2 TIM barrel-domain containing protein [Pelagicoccus albus]|uniref:Beta-galactosidase n=1 Tax=Pelagicoccus albus TaxID=415222 RepID=A0A7X1B5Q0_9BACT|nr:glycoside hydrolase family 2 TIM barrel-domain containing protein [Pelagicoccus albus]MBC2606116.1 hypothetical protein [Pelagicoccus albus]